MVMEEEPSPEFVGREFVRQYYTVLHACPENLHRFYNTDSSFVHGGMEQPGESTRVAKGQAEIHKRIMSLNLRECRAKIHQVDSFETVNGALVIQVIGELGNSGETMRRFVQTFVLVQQSPKSYYVNNDIFRYQDDVFRDEENDATVQSKASISKQRADDAMESSSAVFGQAHQDHHGLPSASENYSGSNGTLTENEPKRNAHHPAQNMTAANTAPAAPFSQQQQRAHVESQQQSSFDHQTKQRQNHRNERERINASNAAQRAISPKPEPEVVASAENTSPVKEAAKPADHSHESRPAPAPNKPLTFAAVAGGGRTSPVAVAAASAPNAANNRQAHAPTHKAASKSQPRDKSPDHSPHGSVSGGDESDSHQVEAPRSGNNAGRNFRNTPSYPNEQQVFVGNLPQDVTDEELQEFMTKFGPVVEVKIVNKQGGRPQIGRITPAFAFVTFEHVESVDKMISSLPINDFRGHMRLNIERKQERERERPNNFYGGQGNYRNTQGSGQGPMGGRGGMRGGMAGRRFPAGPRSGDNRQ